MSVDVIGNFLTIIRNGVMASKPWVVAPYSKIKFDVATILKDEGFIRDVELVENDSVKKEIKVFLKYVNGESVNSRNKAYQYSGRRDYVGANAINQLLVGWAFQY